MAVTGGPDGRLLSCTVITTEATDDVSRIHDRMPMLVEPERFAAWLDPALTRLVRAELTAPQADEPVGIHLVASAIKRLEPQDG